MISRERVKQIAAEFGMRMASPDHPVYKEGPSIRFINRPKKSTTGGKKTSPKKPDPKK